MAKMLQNTFGFILQLCLFSFAMGEETLVEQGHGNSWAYGTSGGVIGFIILILDIIVFIEVLKSNRSPSHKVLWCVIVFLFPILGMVIYYLFSHRDAHMGSGSYEAIP
ncbi:hypothetical protein BJ875DRAFT_470394 [Amylocarpus encephaloides]|uniref:Cardiolipin synthase N-terminal domain-containing protein n=1 Tax=Amylocarpus encephaloides TaxID=45428 RepID=A0A9P8C3M4_9HELO|nr:hypothetical protein BJ875DRAFT_470394 [Amylocarpus encephaloides]